MRVWGMFTMHPRWSTQIKPTVFLLCRFYRKERLYCVPKCPHLLIAANAMAWISQPNSVFETIPIIISKNVEYLLCITPYLIAIIFIAK